jgi:hypothetical protein
MKISFFKSEFETYSPADLMIDMQWSDIVAALTSFVQVPSKEDTEMYNLWEFKVEEIDGVQFIHRCKDTCIALYGLVLDYDNNLSLIDAVEQFAGFECVIYTTYNHAIKGTDKYRVVLPFAAPMPVAEFVKKRKSMIDAFPGVDRASFSRSQAIFLHSGPAADHAFSAHMEGCWMDWTVFQDEVIVEHTVQPTSTKVDADFNDAYKNAVIESLSKCEGFRHMTSLSLAIILKSCGANFADYRAIVAVAGAKDSCIHDPRKQQETWDAVSDDVRITKDKRDKFIVAHGGEPVRVKKVNTIDAKIERLKRKLENVRR